MMGSPRALTSLPVRLAFGTAGGLCLAWVDNVASGGEVSPIVIVTLLFVGTAAAGAVWGRGAWAASAAAWVWMPAIHLIKHALGLPDTLHPDTYGSNFKLAVFTLAVASLGTAAGTAARRLAGMKGG